MDQGICLGMDMALFEAKTITVELLRFLRFEMVEGQKVSYGDKITLETWHDVRYIGTGRGPA